jgi:hypothetical protein
MHCFGGREARAFGGQIERLQPVKPFAFGPHGLAARGQDADARCRSQDGFGQFRNRVEHMLAVVQQQQQRLVLEEGQDVGHGVVHAGGQAQGRGERIRHAPCVAEGSEVDEVNGRLRRFRRDGGSDRHRHGRLPDAAGTDDGHEAVPANLLGQQGDGRFSPHDAIQRGHQAARCLLRGRLRPGPVGSGDAGQWGDEAVASIGSADDVAAIVPSIAQCLAQSGDVNGKIALDDDGAVPDRLEEVVPRDEAPRPFDQQRQDVEGAASEVDAGVALHEHALRGLQREGSEADNFIGQGDAGIGDRVNGRQTRARGDLVDVDRAGAAKPKTASELRSGHPLDPL